MSRTSYFILLHFICDIFHTFSARPHSLTCAKWNPVLDGAVQDVQDTPAVPPNAYGQAQHGSVWDVPILSILHQRAATYNDLDQAPRTTTSAASGSTSTPDLHRIDKPRPVAVPKDTYRIFQNVQYFPRAGGTNKMPGLIF